MLPSRLWIAIAAVATLPAATASAQQVLDAVYRGTLVCDKLPFGWPEKLRHDAATATDTNDDKACGAVIATLEGYVKERFPSCKF